MKAKSDASIGGDDVAQTVRSQARWLLGWGIANLALSFLNSPFGIVLIITGLACYYFGTASMLLVQAVIFLWAAVSNLFVGETLAAAFSVILAVASIQSVRQYRRFRSVESEQPAEYAPSSTASDDSAREERATRLLPVSAFLVAGISWVGFVAAFVFNTAWLMTTGEEVVPSILSFIAGLFLELGALALALGLASVSSGYRYKALSVLGILGGAGILITTLFLATLA